MKILISIFITLSLVYSASIDEKIADTTKDLASSEQDYKDTYSKFKSLGSKIVSENTKIDKLDNDIEKLSKKLKESEQEIVSKKKELEEKKVLQTKLIDNKKNLEIKLVEYLAKNLSISLVLQKTGNQNLDSIMQEEIFKGYSKLIKKETKDLIQQIADSEKVIMSVEQDIDRINRFIEDTNKKVEQFSNLKEEKVKLVNSLDIEKKDYNDKLKTILKEKNKLASLLRQLRITKEEEDKKEAELRVKEEKKVDNLNQKEANMDVRQIGSSYEKVDTAKYKGKKHRPPIEKYEIVKKFGPYTDPIYKLKIFNNSVVFKSLEKNQKVRSVLSGTVVFAKETPTLKKVVIVKHNDGVHTIYAHLDDIASVIKNGKYIPTGYVVGRVSSELVFEVTKKTSYIDPNEFIDIQ